MLIILKTISLILLSLNMQFSIFFLCGIFAAKKERKHISNSDAGQPFVIFSTGQPMAVVQLLKDWRLDFEKKHNLLEKPVHKNVSYFSLISLFFCQFPLKWWTLNSPSFSSYVSIESEFSRPFTSCSLGSPSLGHTKTTAQCNNLSISLKQRIRLHPYRLHPLHQTRLHPIQPITVNQKTGLHPLQPIIPINSLKRRTERIEEEQRSPPSLHLQVVY